MQLIDGVKIAREILTDLSQHIKKLPRKMGLALIVVGNNSASHTYVRTKQKMCLQLSIDSRVEQFDEKIHQKQLLEHIEKLNSDPTIDGILIQLPLPPHLDTQKVMSAVDPTKDVDGFHPINLGKLLMGDPSAIIPCTPLGIQQLLERSSIKVPGKHVVIVGRSNIVGKPLAALLVQKREGCNATITIAHSQTHHLTEITRSADILVAAIGQGRFITQEMVRHGCVVIDVGINRSDGKIVGDVDFESVAPICSAITPVPGGVGPMTVAMLMQNTYRIAYQRIYENAHNLF